MKYEIKILNGTVTLAYGSKDDAFEETTMNERNGNIDQTFFVQRILIHWNFQFVNVLYRHFFQSKSSYR